MGDKNQKTEVFNEGVPKVKAIPYSEKTYAKIGKALGAIDQRKMKLEHELTQGEELVERMKGVEFDPGTLVAFEVILGTNLDSLQSGSIKKIESHKNEIKRIDEVKEKLLANEKLLLLVAEFFDLVYKPNQENQ